MRKHATKLKIVPIQTAIVTITPAMAAQWLQRNLINRNMRLDRINGFANQIKAGTFLTTHQGIAFYDDGTLADGQHRLQAIVSANTSLRMLVTQGLPRQTGQVIDQNAPRAAHDAIRIGGGGEWINRNVVAVVRFLLSQMGTDLHSKPPHEISAYANKYEEGLKEVDAIINRRRKRYFAHAGLAASYFCALQAGVSRDTLARFVDIMFTGEIQGVHENAAIRLREFLISTPGAWIGTTRTETSRRVQRAIHFFASGTPLSKLYATENLTYPTPN